MRKNIIVIPILLLAFGLKSKAQIKIGSNPTIISTNTFLEVESVGSHKFVVTKDSSKVGSGTVSPAAKLDVIGKVKITDGTQGAGKLFVSNATGVGSWQSAASALSGIEPWFSTSTNTGATSNTENIYSLGKVGIGTATPSDFLEVKSSISGEGVRLSSSLTNNFGTIGIKVGAQSAGDRYMYYNNDFATSALARAHVFAAGAKDLMTISQFGNVGIGVSSPSAELHVSNVGGDSTVAQKAIMVLQNATNAYTFYLANNFNDANWGSLGADYIGNGINNAMVINSPNFGSQVIFGDNVGPWSTGVYKLGHTYARWSDIYLTNSPNVSSDARLKSDIQPLSLGLNAVLRMKPKIYRKYATFEKKGNATNEYGFIAQDLKEILPLAVEGEATGQNPMGVKYEQIIPILTKAIQEQQSMIEKLMKELDIQKEENRIQTNQLITLSKLLHEATNLTIEKAK